MARPAYAGAHRRLPAVVLGLSLAALAAAGLLWGTAPVEAHVPATPVELAAVLSLVGGFLLWRRPGHRIAALVAVTGVLFSLVSLAAAALAHNAVVAASTDQVALAATWLASALAAPWMLLILWFPDGRFTDPRWRRVFVVAAAAAALAGLAGYLFGPPGSLPAMLGKAPLRSDLGGPFAAADRGYLLTLVDATVVLPVIALPALVARFRRAGAVVRQQIRWLLVAAVATIVGAVTATALGHGSPTTAAVGMAVAAAVQPLPALAIAVAVLRYRLWDIDVVVSRALVYGALWAGLSLLLLVPALVSGLLVGGSGAVAAVGVALAVTLAFQPLARRMRAAVEARVYGARRRGALQLARFGEALRAAVDVDEVGPRVADTVRTALRVPWTVVWAYLDASDGGVLRPVGSAGMEHPPPVRLPAGTATTLRELPVPCAAHDAPSDVYAVLPAPLGAVVPLVAGAELVGLLAVAERAGEPLDARDLEPLGRFAGECALGLRGLQLDAELRERLADIEAQAVELRQSRQRLVRAQDDERRRIERDLHDGVQQQLVALATNARRLALRSDPAARAGYEQLAADAEDAVFSLQDIARGIFPGVLTDQGLAAALRAHAGRSPLPVRVDIEPVLAGRRFDPEVEAALYFVALEALTNVAKHAGDAQASVTLRTGGPGHRLVLEIHDDGPGLPRQGRRPGSGLVNMRDRVAAAGGELTIESRPGAGTWLRADVPLTADVVSLHPADADSRR